MLEVLELLFWPAKVPNARIRSEAEAKWNLSIDMYRDMSDMSQFEMVL